jgi:tetratricopeptide (TPR) repeat protein
MKSDSSDTSAPFNLGNLLRVDSRNVEAEAALRAATRADPTFVEAWYNLSDLLDEQGRSEAAIECLRTALRVAPDYADAIFSSRCYYNEKMNTRKPLITGVAILPTNANRNGPHERVDH